MAKRLQFEVRWLSLALVAVLVSACASSGQPADPKAIEAETERLLAPYLTGTEVGCNELLIEMTGNFNEYVFQPALDTNAHTLRHEGAPDGTYIDKIWTNTLGRRDMPFIVSVGEPPDVTRPGEVAGQRTTFTVTNQVRLRIYQGRHPWTLNANGTGETVVVWPRGRRDGPPAREFLIEDGVQKRP